MSAATLTMEKTMPILVPFFRVQPRQRRRKHALDGGSKEAVKAHPDVVSSERDDADPDKDADGGAKDDG